MFEIPTLMGMDVRKESPFHKKFICYELNELSRSTQNSLEIDLIPHGMGVWKNMTFL